MASFPDLRRVFSEWKSNDEDSTSDRIRAMRKPHDCAPISDYIEVEMEWTLFADLAVFPEAWGDEYEPDDWDFDGKHSYLKHEKRKIDQPWLDTVRDGKEWIVDTHEGRHRVAYLAQREGYTHVTVLMGLNWCDDGPKGARVGDVFVQRRHCIRAVLVRDDRCTGAEFALRRLG